MDRVQAIAARRAMPQLTNDKYLCAQRVVACGSGVVERCVAASGERSHFSMAVQLSQQSKANSVTTGISDARCSSSLDQAGSATAAANITPTTISLGNQRSIPDSHRDSQRGPQKWIRQK